MPNKLTCSQLIKRLREHAAKHGFVSTENLVAHDRLVLRSIPLHFPGIAAARHAAGVSGPPYRKPRRKTGPKSGSKPSHVRAPEWSRARVLDELRRLHRAGKSTVWQDLMTTGHAKLIHAAHQYAGGLARARKAARIPTTKRRVPKKPWTRESVLSAIRARRRAGESLAATAVPQGLYGAARRHYGSWPAALAIVGLDAKAFHVDKKKYTKETIIQRLRAAARAGSDLRQKSVARVVDLKAITREFGTLGAAIRAAGLTTHLEKRAHGLRKWNRERVVETVRERAEHGIPVFTPGLRRAAQAYVGSSAMARAAAGLPPDPRRLWTRERVIDELRARAREGLHTMTSALYRHSRELFGGAREARIAANVPEPAPRAQWSRSRIIEVLRERAREGDHTITSALYQAARNHFGGLRKARKAAKLPDPHPRWSRERVIEELRARAREGLPMTSALYQAARTYFGGLPEARRAAKVPDPQPRWTRERVIEELRARARKGIQTMTRALASASRNLFGSARKARSAAGLPDPPHPRARWSREAIIEELVARARKGIQTMTPSLSQASRKFFGSARKARRAANLPDPPHPRARWSREAVIEELRARARKALHTMPPTLYRAARVYFGSAYDARRAAGVPDPIDMRIEQRRRDAAAFEARHRKRSRPRRATT